MFRLLKYYLDLVTEDGTALIGYAARLRLGGIQVGYSSVLLSAPGASPLERSTLDRSPLPGRSGDAITWDSPGIRLTGRWLGQTAPIHRALLQGQGGAIQWTCHMPRATGTVRVGETALTGIGYVDSLRLTIAPWRLPFRTLRWGRHASADHSLVWIDWAGGSEARWIWLDGAEQPGAGFSATGLTGLPANTSLEFSDSRDVRDRRVLASLGEVLPRLIPRLAPRLAAMREHKQLSRSSLNQAGRALDQGWSLHEQVTW
jgi:hypothetical protein